MKHLFFLFNNSSQDHIEVNQGANSLFDQLEENKPKNWRIKIEKFSLRTIEEFKDFSTKKLSHYDDEDEIFLYITGHGTKEGFDFDTPISIGQILLLISHPRVTSIFFSNCFSSYIADAINTVNHQVRTIIACTNELGVNFSNQFEELFFTKILEGQTLRTAYEFSLLLTNSITHSNKKIVIKGGGVNIQIENQEINELILYQDPAFREDIFYNPSLLYKIKSSLEKENLKNLLITYFEHEDDKNNFYEKYKINQNLCSIITINKEEILAESFVHNFKLISTLIKKSITHHPDIIFNFALFFYSENPENITIFNKLFSFKNFQGSNKRIYPNIKLTTILTHRKSKKKSKFKIKKDLKERHKKIKVRVHTEDAFEHREFVDWVFTSSQRIPQSILQSATLDFNCKPATDSLINILRNIDQIPIQVVLYSNLDEKTYNFLVNRSKREDSLKFPSIIIDNSFSEESLLTIFERQVNQYFKSEIRKNCNSLVQQNCLFKDESVLGAFCLKLDLSRKSEQIISDLITILSKFIAATSEYMNNGQLDILRTNYFFIKTEEEFSSILDKKLNLLNKKAVLNYQHIHSIDFVDVENWIDEYIDRLYYFRQDYYQPFMECLRKIDDDLAYGTFPIECIKAIIETLTVSERILHLN